MDVFNLLTEGAVSCPWWESDICDASQAAF